MDREHDWKALIKMLKDISEKKGISQVHIAEKTGRLQPAISRFFSGKRIPRIDLFFDVAEAIDIHFALKEVQKKKIRESPSHK